MTTNKSKTKTTAPAVEAEVDDSKPLGRFAQLARDAVADYVPKKPYVLDEFDPPIVITEPVETERIIAFAMLMDPSIEVSPAQFQPLLQAVCGDVYPRVWTDLLRGKHFKVTSAFMRDVVTHFFPKGAALASNGAGDVPGGSQGS